MVEFGQFEIRLVYQSGRPEGVPREFATEVAMGDAFQLLVNGRKDVVELSVRDQGVRVLEIQQPYQRPEFGFSSTLTPLISNSG
jgi:hypothetical protein